METVKFYIVDPIAFYKAFLNQRYNGFKIISISFDENGCVYVSVRCNIHQAFWIGFEYRSYFSIK
jgi:hypothetical protein